MNCSILLSVVVESVLSVTLVTIDCYDNYENPIEENYPAADIENSCDGDYREGKKRRTIG